MRLPRELEADGTAEAILNVLSARTAPLWSGSDFSVPVISVGDFLRKAIQRANSRGHLRYGLEAISEKLEGDRKGIEHLRDSRGIPAGERISRLLFISNDGSQRFYRHIQHLLQLHASRIIACMLDLDGRALGSIVTGKEKQIKIIMAEHKGAVSELLRELLENRHHQSTQSGLLLLFFSLCLPFLF